MKREGVLNRMTTKELQDHRVDNAVIMAAGLSSRFAPLSYEYPKALLKVKGEILIERQIRQLQEAGIDEIIIVVGYKKEQYDYLIDKYQIKIVENPEYQERNNHSSLYYVRKKLGNTYICSADNYFTENVFESHVPHAYYSAVFEEGETDEWTLQTDDTGLITDVKIGGRNSWVMLGHAFFSNEFSKKFVEILEEIYDYPETTDLLWESIYHDYIEELPMFLRKYSQETIFEFDSLDELREFDQKYVNNSGSKILQQIAQELSCEEKDIKDAKPIKKDDQTIGFEFSVNGQLYQYLYETKELSEKIITGEEVHG